MAIDRPVEILLVEDNPGDVRLTREALLELNVKHSLHVVTDGEAALEFLFRKGRHTKAVRPDLILLDLNLPRRNGREVLEQIKKDEDLKLIPVLVLTTSGSPLDIRAAYSLHANSYIVKPRDLDKFWEVASAIEEFWLKTATLPAA
jgi:two-component system, chemotaxis family, response regulator Rcp1